MRVSTAQFYQQNADGMRLRQSALNELLQKISAGQKYLRAAEDPFASSRSLELDQIVTRTQQYQDNIDSARATLGLQDTVLGDVTSLLQRTREITLQANNGTMTQVDRNSIATELRERLAELTGLVNTIGPDGDYLYAGHRSTSQPFVNNTIGEFSFVQYQGDQGSRFVQISTSRQLQASESGAEVFLRIDSNAGLNTDAPVTNTGTGVAAPAYVFDPTSTTGNTYRIQFNAGGTTYDIVNETTATTIVSGATYTAGSDIEFDGIRTAINGAPALGDVFRISSSGTQDLFTTMNQLIATLERPVSSTVTHAALAQSIENIDSALSHISNSQAQVGGRLNALDSQQDENAAYVLQTQEALSKLRDLDYAEAITQLEHTQFTLQAVQSAFARVEGLSLFNYLR